MICRNCGFSETPANVGSRADSDAQQRLADINSEIIRLQALRVSINQDINARTPLLQLPPEISSEIFSIYLENERALITDPISEMSMTPLLLGGVCHAWRQLAWSTPKLWTLLQLDLHKSIDPVMVRQWLVCSGDQLISIYATLRTGCPVPPVVAIMHIIGEHSQRWQKISFRLPPFCYDALEGVKDRLPNLNYISIDEDLLEQTKPRLLNMFSVAPLLRIVHLKAFLDQFVFPLSQLTECSIDYYHAGICMDMLRRSPNVVTCSIKGSFSSSGDLQHTLADRLESLYLTFQDRYTDSISAIFDSLTIPAIRNLSCVAVGHDFPRSSFVSLMSRSSCSLRTLSLTTMNISDMEFAECLRALPLLNKLSLTNVFNLTNQFLQMLDPCHSSNASWLLPNLETFECLGFLQLDLRVVASLLQSRWDIRQTSTTLDEPFRITQLQSVKLVDAARASEPNAPTLALLRGLVEEGMRISLVTRARKWL